MPYLSMKLLSFASSSGDHGPLFTFSLSQHGALPISLSLSLYLCLYVSHLEIGLFQSKISLLFVCVCVSIYVSLCVCVLLNGQSCLVGLQVGKRLVLMGSVKKYLFNRCSTQVNRIRVYIIMVCVIN